MKTTQEFIEGNTDQEFNGFIAWHGPPIVFESSLV